MLVFTSMMECQMIMIHGVKDNISQKMVTIYLVEGQASSGTRVGLNLQKGINHHRPGEERDAEGRKIGKGCPLLH